ncbi:MAG: Xaa-Pro aminopeptidase [Gammaproteobacteria bacterium]|nr:Xaa-Pro aminopeptidase [Gammaproteobacteria bacterium]
MVSTDEQSARVAIGQSGNRPEWQSARVAIGQSGNRPDGLRVDRGWRSKAPSETGGDLNKKEFARRRKRVMNMMDEKSVAIVPTSPVKGRSRDVEFPFRPDSDFMYLTGFPEPDAVAVLIPGRPQGEFVLFCRERDVERELWDGFRAGLEGACDVFGADDAFPIGDIDDILPNMLEGRTRVYYAMGCYPEFDQRMLGYVNRLRSRARTGTVSPAEFVALDHILHEMRLYKSSAEVRAMKKAGAISARAHRRAMQHCRPGLYEYQIEAELSHEFMLAGSRSPAYPSIVAGGANACVMHYVENQDRLKAGDLLLIDAGCELDYYASDITRTFPVDGRFSKEQRELYEIVLEAQYAAIDKTRPGHSWNDPHEAAVEVITRGLVDLGILKGRLPKLLADEAYRPFYMHRTGHWLGMDVHDVGDYKIDGHWRELEPGMVTTVEPGLYIRPGEKTVPKRFWGIGIRIEDDVLVTPNGHEVLTHDVPKSVDEVEALVGSAR